VLPVLIKLWFSEMPGCNSGDSSRFVHNIGNLGTPVVGVVMVYRPVVILCADVTVHTCW